MVKQKKEMTAREKLDKMFPGAARPLSEYPPERVIPTGSLSVDLALGLGGVGIGRITEIYGGEGSGKTTLALMIAVEAQALGILVGFIDVERSLRMKYAESVGIKIDDLFYIKPNSGEDALNAVSNAIKAGAGLLIVDSVAALAVKAELEGDIGDAHVGLQARLMSAAMRKLTGNTSDQQAALVFVNQQRMKIATGFAAKRQKGDGKTTPGGKALKYYTSIRMDVKKGAGFIEDKNVKIDKWNFKKIGQPVIVDIAKNKLGAPHKRGKFNLIYDKGIDKIMDVFDTAMQIGLIQDKGSGHYYIHYEGKKPEKIAHGKEKAIEFITKHPGLVEDLTTTIREYIIEESN